ncbi:hypothetical protein PLESTF_000568700 [Pleodorina starrii]|nr:hypothetical protein PLESTF_000568700 [Pleodorina starrii]
MTPVAPRAAPGVRLVTTFRSRGARNSLRPAAASAVPPRNPATSPPQQPGPPSASNDPAATSRPRRPPAWIVGVDFGTYASGFGYSKAASPDSSSSSNSGGEAQPDVGTAPPPAPVKLHHSWPDQPLQDFKTRTVCLYRGNKLVGPWVGGSVGLYRGGEQGCWFQSMLEVAGAVGAEGRDV